MKLKKKDLFSYIKNYKLFSTQHLVKKRMYPTAGLNELLIGCFNPKLSQIFLGLIFNTCVCLFLPQGWVEINFAVLKCVKINVGST